VQDDRFALVNAFDLLAVSELHSLHRFALHRESAIDRAPSISSPDDSRKILHRLTAALALVGVHC
jgi:uncharacterized protein YciW